MHSPAHARASVGGVLKDAAALLGLVLFVPFAILAVGAPIALVIAGVLWLARLAQASL
jgi:hypothetical protein